MVNAVINLIALVLGFNQIIEVGGYVTFIDDLGNTKTLYLEYVTEHACYMKVMDVQEFVVTDTFPQAENAFLPRIYCYPTFATIIVDSDRKELVDFLVAPGFDAIIGLGDTFDYYSDSGVPWRIAFMGIAEGFCYYDIGTITGAGGAAYLQNLLWTPETPDEPSIGCYTEYPQAPALAIHSDTKLIFTAPPCEYTIFLPLVMQE